MKSKYFRNTSAFLRNEFETDGIWGFPIIRKQELDLSDINLIACSDTSAHDEAKALYRSCWNDWL